MQDLIDLLGADRYGPLAECLTYDPIIMTLLVATSLATALSLMVSGVIAIRFRSTAFNNPASVSIRAIYGVFGVALSLVFLMNVILVFSAVYRLAAIIWAAIAALSITILVMTARVLAGRL